jgi:hypothetical protein
VAYLVLAKLVVALHFGFVVFIFAGAYVAVTHRWVIWLHVPAIAYAILITVVGWSCPLTILEQRLLDKAGAPVYVGEFLPHYVWSRFGLTGAEVSVAVGLIIALVLVSARPYWLIFRQVS